MKKNEDLDLLQATHYQVSWWNPSTWRYFPTGCEHTLTLAASDMMTLPNADRLALIHWVSFSLSPADLDSFSLSEPARSTKFSVPTSSVYRYKHSALEISLHSQNIGQGSVTRYRLVYNKCVDNVILTYGARDKRYPITAMDRSWADFLATLM